MKKLGILALFLVVLHASAMAAYAGTINPEEARVIDAASGIFVYEGVSYESTDSALSSLTAYLNQDGVDLTALQADRAIQLMMYEKNILTAIEEGYIVPVEGGSGGNGGNGGNDGGNGNGNGDGDGDGGGDGNGEEPGNGEPTGKIRLLFREAILEAVNESGSVVYEGSLPVKNTGYHLDWTLAAALAGAIALVFGMGAALPRLKGSRRHVIVPLAFVLLLAGALLLGGQQSAGLIRDQINRAFVLGAPETSCTGAMDALYGKDAPEDGILAASDILLPGPGSCYAHLDSEASGLAAPVYFGDWDAIFAKGAGQYALGGFPGEGRAILIGGHDVSWFAPLEDVREGDEIRLHTSYGKFTYEVDAVLIGTAGDSTWQEAAGKPGERLVLYTCWPMGSLFGARDERLYIICEKTGGPRLVGTGGL